MRQLISIIIPCYNRKLFIADAIDSALRHNCDNQEVIVIDDGSTDGSWDEIAKFADKVKAVRTENGGVAKARNMGIRLSSAKYIIFLDSDDRLAAGAVRAYSTVAKGDQETIFLGLARCIDEGGAACESMIYKRPSSWRSSEVPATRILSAWASNCACLIPKELILKAGGYDENLSLGEDYDLNFRMLMAGGKFQLIDEHVYDVRLHFGPKLTRNVSGERYSAMCSLFRRTWRTFREEFSLPDNCEDRVRLAQWCWSMGRTCYRAEEPEAGDEFVSLAREIAGRDARNGTPVVRALYNFLRPRDVERASEMIKSFSSAVRKPK